MSVFVQRVYWNYIETYGKYNLFWFEIDLVDSRENMIKMYERTFE